MNRLLPVLLLLIWAQPGQAAEFAENWLRNCLVSAQEDARSKMVESYCIQGVFDVCEHSDSADICRDGVTQMMKVDTKRLISIIPSEFGKSEIERTFYARNYDMVVTGEGLPMCAPEDGIYPGCEATKIAWIYQFVRGLAAKVENQ